MAVVLTPAEARVLSQLRALFSGGAVFALHEVFPPPGRASAAARYAGRRLLKKGFLRVAPGGLTLAPRPNLTGD